MTLHGVEVVPVVLLVLGLFVAVRTVFLVRARRTTLRRPAVRLLPRPASPVRAVAPARAVAPVRPAPPVRVADQPRARAQERRAA